MTKMTKVKSIPSSNLEDLENKTRLRNKRTRANAPVYNDFFAKMAQVVDDPFWKYHFIEASTGTFPPNVSYYDGMLKYKFDGESLLTIDTEVTDPQLIKIEALKVISFLRSKLELYSPQDFENFFKFDSTEDDEEIGNIWSKIKNRQRTIALVDFVKSEKVKRNLTHSQYIELEQLVNICRVLKYINSETVEVRKHRIISQSFILFNEETKRYYINPNVSKNVKFKPQKKKVKKVAQTYGQKWKEFQATTLALDASHGPLPHLRNYKFPISEQRSESNTSSSEN